MFDFARLSRAELEAMAACGRQVFDCERALAQAGRSLLSEAVGVAGQVHEWQHYPEGDIYDPETHAQYFYHAHPAGERGAGEQGHFHTFLRGRGMPAGMRPLVMPELAIADNPAAPKAPFMPSAPRSHEGEDGDPWSHLVAVALDAAGRPLRFFTTNRWVTGETWYAAADVAAMLDRFAIGSVPPSALLNRWVPAMIGFYKPQLVELLFARDAAVMAWRRRRRAKVHVFEDRRLEITSSFDIDLEVQRHSVETALRRVA